MPELTLPAMCTAEVPSAYMPRIINPGEDTGGCNETDPVTGLVCVLGADHRGGHKTRWPGFETVWRTQPAPPTILLPWGLQP